MRRMRILAWHVHGSWMTAFVNGPRRPRTGGSRPRTGRPGTRPDLGLAGQRAGGRPGGGGGPAAGGGFDVVVLQRPQEIELFRTVDRPRAGIDVPAVYVEHNTPPGDVAGGGTRWPTAGTSRSCTSRRSTQLMWDCGDAPTTVIEHGIVDPGHLYTGALGTHRRRWSTSRSAAAGGRHRSGARAGRAVPLEVYGMGTSGARADRCRIWPVICTTMSRSTTCTHAVGQPRLPPSLPLDQPRAGADRGDDDRDAGARVPGDRGAGVGPGGAGAQLRPDVLLAAARRWLADPDEARRGRVRRSPARPGTFWPATVSD